MTYAEKSSIYISIYGIAFFYYPVNGTNVSGIARFVYLVNNIVTDVICKVLSSINLVLNSSSHISSSCCCCK